MLRFEKKKKKTHTKKESLIQHTEDNTYTLYAYTYEGGGGGGGRGKYRPPPPPPQLFQVKNIGYRYIDIAYRFAHAKEVHILSRSDTSRVASMRITFTCNDDYLALPYLPRCPRHYIFIFTPLPPPPPPPPSTTEKHLTPPLCVHTCMHTHHIYSIISEKQRSVYSVQKTLLQIRLNLYNHMHLCHEVYSSHSHTPLMVCHWVIKTSTPSLMGLGPQSRGWVIVYSELYTILSNNLESLFSTTITFTSSDFPSATCILMLYM